MNALVIVGVMVAVLVSTSQVAAFEDDLEDDVIVGYAERCGDRTEELIFEIVEMNVFEGDMLENFKREKNIKAYFYKIRELAWGISPKDYLEICGIDECATAFLERRSSVPRGEFWPAKVCDYEVGYSRPEHLEGVGKCVSNIHGIIDYISMLRNRQERSEIATTLATFERVRYIMLASTGSIERYLGMCDLLD